jgi:hypothetical protein
MIEVNNINLIITFILSTGVLMKIERDMNAGYRDLQEFKMKYLISLEEFLFNGKRNYNQFHFYANSRCHYGRWKFSRLLCRLS